MEILNILYNNNFIAFYLIGAILVVIFIFIVLSSMSTTKEVGEKDNKEEILQDPTENEDIPIIEEKKEVVIEQKKEEIKDIPKINDLVEDLYQQKIHEESNQMEDTQDLNSFLEEFEVPNNIIEEVISNEQETIVDKIEEPSEILSDINPETKEEHANNNSENIESMLKRLYDLRQNESNIRKSALLNEIYDLKKQVDETLKAKDYNYSINYSEIDTKALADYYLFNEDIEFPKLK